jgi:diguanylate cyclase (GGDEF)-like protein/PAS domain S-box-containing protein
MPAPTPASTPAPAMPIQPTDRANPGLLDAIFASATDFAIITTDMHGSIVSWNKGAEHVFGYTSSEIVGQPLARIFTPSDVASGEVARELECARRVGRSDDVRWHSRKDGSIFWADGVMTTIRDAYDNITGFLKILRDETERKRAEAERMQLARIDPLTGVGNRTALGERLAEMSASALRSRDQLAFHLLDLNNFKQVNDHWGHLTGDKLLQQVTGRIRGVIRDSDFIARLGGDEFVVLQSNLHSPEAGATLAAKLVEVLSEPFRIDGHEVLSGVSIGIAMYPQDASDQDQLMRKADLALYKVKKNHGNGGYHYFSEDLDADAHKKTRLQAALKRAVKGHDFHLEYQPEIDASSGTVVAVEALLRCHDPLLASLPVDDIITLAADSGQMLEIGLWVLNQACTQSRKWRDEGLPPFKVCINLCPHELLDAGLANHIKLILEQSGLPAESLEVEITERDIIDSAGQGWTALSQLRALGVSIALDDFGTGYSALSKLNGVPVDKIKLDRSFLETIPANPDSCAIVSAIINLVHTLRLEIIIEGVESPEQVEFFKREHCETLQGNFFSRPLRGDAVPAWLEQHSMR